MHCIMMYLLHLPPTGDRPQDQGDRGEREKEPQPSIAGGEVMVLWLHHCLWKGSGELCCYPVYPLAPLRLADHEHAW